MSDLRDRYLDLHQMAEEAIEYGGRAELERVIRGLLTVADAFVDVAQEGSETFGTLVLAAAMSGTPTNGDG